MSAKTYVIYSSEGKATKCNPSQVDLLLTRGFTKEKATKPVPAPVSQSEKLPEVKPLQRKPINKPPEAKKVK